MYKKDLTLNDPQWLICHKTKLINPFKQVNTSYLVTISI